LRLRTIEWFGRIVETLASVAAFGALVSAPSALVSAAVLSGITAVIVLFAFAVVETNALLTDSDAFLGGTCVKGGTCNKDHGRNQQRSQLKEGRFAH
jgi:hypothetical protein